MTSASSIAPGLVLGRYVIQHRLGAGGMGEVFLADDSSLRRQVAVKVLSERHLDSGDLRERFTREARAVAAINHPNVVQIFDISEHGGRPYFVMEYLRGMDAGELLQRKGKLSLPEVISIGLSAALGLAEAASAGVVHRDVKPANLFVTTRGVVKVTDFGLAKATTALLGASLTVEGMTLGTPDYMAPEQGRGDEVDARADVYSLGCTLFHLVAGRPPYRGNDERIAYPAVVARHIQQELPRLEHEVPEAPPELAALVLRMMAKDPAQRPSYDDTIRALQAVAGGMGGPPSRISLPATSAPVDGSTAAPTAPEVPQAAPLPAQPQPSGELRVPLALPRWLLGLTITSLAIFAVTLALYFFLRPKTAGPIVEPRPGTSAGALIAAGTGSGTGRRWTPLVTVRLPDGKSIAVRRRPISPEEIASHAPGLEKSLRPIQRVAVGLSLEQARTVVAKMSGRLPTSKEWLALTEKTEAAASLYFFPDNCEWVDDGKTPKARCFKWRRAVRRARDKPCKDTLFRMVVSVEDADP